MGVSSGESDGETPMPSMFHAVRCLGCGAVYPKPARGGTVAVNPGCPKCGYVGWLTTSSPTALALRHRFAADHRRRRSA
jgi:predicted  nucleic acid-binding Zn-ribbon protein